MANWNLKNRDDNDEKKPKFRDNYPRNYPYTEKIIHR